MRVQFKTILCATDFSDFSNHTVRFGVALAKEFDARLYVCHVIDLSSVAIYGEFQLDPIGQQNRIIQDANAQLEDRREQLHLSGHTSERYFQFTK